MRERGTIGICGKTCGKLPLTETRETNICGVTAGHAVVRPKEAG